VTPRFSRISEMKDLLACVANLALLVPSEKMAHIASRIHLTSPDKVPMELRQAVGTPAAAGMIERLIDAWKGTTVTPAELALMLTVADNMHARLSNEQSTELVWTGPTTPFVSARRTEQALLQVINAAEATLFITSFVAYDVSSIVTALNEASERGVAVSMLLELSRDEGGSVSFDVIGRMRALIPSANIYSWRDKTTEFLGGSVHAKVAVADGKVCFITSANLTGHAMEKNMEAGLLIVGGSVPGMLADHLQALVQTRVVSPI